MNPVDLYTYARGIVRGVKRGTTFPASTRRSFQAAPGGSRVLSERRAVGNQLVALEHTEHVLPVHGLASPLSILQLSDCHIRGHDDVLDTILGALVGLTPDLVVLTGDTITRGWKRDAADRLLAALPDAPLGRFAIMGNWEYWGRVETESWRWFCGRHGVRLLLNESVALDPLTLCGTDDLLAGTPDVAKTYSGVDFSRPVVTLTHSPALFPELVRPGVNLVLSGHTHGGQVLLPLVGAPFLPRASGEFPAGWYHQDGTWLFVSRGVGWSVAPFRVRCRPELATIRLVPGSLVPPAPPAP